MCFCRVMHLTKEWSHQNLACLCGAVWFTSSHLGQWQGVPHEEPVWETELWRKGGVFLCVFLAHDGIWVYGVGMMTHLTLSHCEGTAHVQLLWFHCSEAAFSGEGCTLMPIWQSKDVTSLWTCNLHCAHQTIYSRDYFILSSQGFRCNCLEITYVLS